MPRTMLLVSSRFQRQSNLTEAVTIIMNSSGTVFVLQRIAIDQIRKISCTDTLIRLGITGIDSRIASL